MGKLAKVKVYRRNFQFLRSLRGKLAKTSKKCKLMHGQNSHNYKLKLRSREASSMRKFNFKSQ